MWLISVRCVIFVLGFPAAPSLHDLYIVGVTHVTPYVILYVTEYREYVVNFSKILSLFCSFA